MRVHPPPPRAARNRHSTLPSTHGAKAALRCDWSVFRTLLKEGVAEPMARGGPPYAIAVLGGYNSFAAHLDTTGVDEDDPDDAADLVIQHLFRFDDCDDEAWQLPPPPPGEEAHETLSHLRIPYDTTAVDEDIGPEHFLASRIETALARTAANLFGGLFGDAPCHVRMFALIFPPGNTPEVLACVDEDDMPRAHWRVRRTAAQDAARGADLLARTKAALEGRYLQADRFDPQPPPWRLTTDVWVNPQLMAVADPPGGDALFPDAWMYDLRMRPCVCGWRECTCSPDAGMFT